MKAQICFHWRSDVSEFEHLLGVVNPRTLRPTCPYPPITKCSFS